MLSVAPVMIIQTCYYPYLMNTTDKLNLIVLEQMQSPRALSVFPYLQNARAD